MPAKPAGDPAAAETLVRGDGHEATSGTDYHGQRATETGDRTGQRALHVCGMPEDGDREQRPPKRQRALNACRQQGEEGGRGPLTLHHTPTARSQGPEGDPQTWQHAPLVRSQGMVEEGVPPTHQRAQPARRQGREGATPTMKRRNPNVHPEEGVGGGLQRAQPVHGMLERGKGGPLEQEGYGAPPLPQSSVRFPCTACRTGRDGGAWPRGGREGTCQVACSPISALRG